MSVLRVLGFFSVVPATMLVTVSFFVMFTLGKVEKSYLRIFGMVAVALLLIAAFIVFATGIFIVAQEAEFPGYYNSMVKSNIYSYPSMMKGRHGMMMQDKCMQFMRHEMQDENIPGEK